MQQKIITMTQLALYDKHEGADDLKVNDYFRHDYIYKKNLGTRMAVGIGGFIMLVLYWTRTILLDEYFDLFNLDFQTYLYDSLLFILAILALYSLIGTVQGTREYYLVQKRLTRYHALMRQLEKINDRAQKSKDEKVEGEAVATEPSGPRVPRPRLPVLPRESGLDETRSILRPELEAVRAASTPVSTPVEDLNETRPLSSPVYKNPFPPNPQRSQGEPNGTNTDNP